MFKTKSVTATSVITILAMMVVPCPLFCVSSLYAQNNNPVARFFKKPTPQQAALRNSHAKSVFDHQTVQQRLNALIVDARHFEKHNQWQDALQTYEHVLAINQNVALAHHRVAVILDILGRSDVAIPHYQAAIRLAPGNAEVFCDYGYHLYLQENTVEAARHYQRAIELDRNLTRAYINLGMLYAMNSQRPAALQQFAMAGCNPDQAQLNLNFAAELAGAVNQFSRSTANPQTVQQSHRPQYSSSRTRETPGYQAQQAKFPVRQVSWQLPVTEQKQSPGNSQYHHHWQQRTTFQSALQRPAGPVLMNFSSD